MAFAVKEIGERNEMLSLDVLTVPPKLTFPEPVWVNEPSKLKVTPEGIVKRPELTMATGPVPVVVTFPLNETAAPFA